MASVERRVVGGGLVGLVERLQNLANREVLVGIPAGENARNSGEINNAALLYIHTHGSPLRNIPARPVIEPAIEDAKDRIAREIRLALEAAGDGRADAAEQYLERAGMAAQNASRAWFTNPNNHWAPNSPRTIAQKGSSRPLIDTGSLRKSIIYVVRDKK